jgi:predicted nucleic acid-binding protein
MKVLVDTNVLVRTAHVGHGDQALAIAALERLRNERHELRTVPQVLYEYWAVATRPPDKNGLGFGVEEVDRQIREFQILFPTLRDERGILDPWQKLALDYQVLGKQAHDAHLVAAMQRHALTHLLTFNVEHFRRFAGVELLDPKSYGAPSP